MTAVAAQQLAEQQLIDLDVPIQTYLPEYPKHSAGEITQRQLLQHTSGVAAYKNTKKVESTPEGRIYSTVSDTLKFGQALLNYQLITATSFELVIENPKIRTVGNGYGMGCFLYGKNEKRGIVIGHSGGQTESAAPNS